MVQSWRSSQTSRQLFNCSKNDWLFYQRLMRAEQLLARINSIGLWKRYPLDLPTPRKAKILSEACLHWELLTYAGKPSAVRWHLARMPCRSLVSPLMKPIDWCVFFEKTTKRCCLNYTKYFDRMRTVTYQCIRSIMQILRKSWRSILDRIWKNSTRPGLLQTRKRKKIPCHSSNDCLAQSMKLPATL